jgi:Cu+-exporting ATPase
MNSRVAQASPGSEKKEARACYHCGTVCLTEGIVIGDKHFCCEGCKLVYQMLDSNDLCNYYTLEQHPGLSQIKGIRKDKFAYLDDAAIAEKLCSFRAGDYSIVTLYLPGVHCASCMWLLEHLCRVNPAITQSRLSFSTREITIHFLHREVSLRQVAELLAAIGYEPYISLDDADKKQAAGSSYDRKRIYKLGIAGFCFGNIMMMAFPEYFGGEGLDRKFASLFRYASLGLSIPVVFYCAAEFFVNTWKGLRNIFPLKGGAGGSLNIDAPIALAILITWLRSLYEIFTATGSGYLDSMSGIVFFMLVGRAVQERTYSSISFHRDYKAYFPIAVMTVTEQGLQSRSLHELKPGDVVQLASGEIIPADGTVLKGEARIDYSFVTGESEPLHIPAGQKAYAGGRQTSGQMQMVVEKPVAGSYLTSLWNNHAFAKDKQTEAYRRSSVHRLSNWFTIALFSLAALTAMWWAIHDPSRIIPAVSAMLIVACPCALLLSATFTNGSTMRLLSNNGLFLRDATVIETLGTADHIVFDKTGTLTAGNSLQFAAHSLKLSEEEKILVYAIASRSNHPRSRALAALISEQEYCNVLNWEEVPGAGVRGMVRGHRVLIGNALFTGSPGQADLVVRIDGSFCYFHAAPVLRCGLGDAIARLNKRFGLSLLSGDNNRQERDMRSLFGNSSILLFSQKPKDKLAYIETLQQSGHKVIMLGDGLNDSGALQQSDAGITLAEDVNNFTPACDAILDAKKIHQLPALLALARWGRYTICIAFVISVLYNIVGLSFAVRGTLSPMIAAFLMPASTGSIVLISVGVTGVASRLLLGKR